MTWVDARRRGDCRSVDAGAKETRLNLAERGLSRVDGSRDVVHEESQAHVNFSGRLPGHFHVVFFPEDHQSDVVPGLSSVGRIYRFLVLVRSASESDQESEIATESHRKEHLQKVYHRRPWPSLLFELRKRLRRSPIRKNPPQKHDEFLPGDHSARGPRSPVLLCGDEPFQSIIQFTRRKSANFREQPTDPVEVLRSC